MFRLSSLLLLSSLAGVSAAIPTPLSDFTGQLFKLSDPTYGVDAVTNTSNLCLSLPNTPITPTTLPTLITQECSYAQVWNYASATGLITIPGTDNCISLATDYPALSLNCSKASHALKQDLYLTFDIYPGDLITRDSTLDLTIDASLKKVKYTGGLSIPQVWTATTPAAAAQTSALADFSNVLIQTPRIQGVAGDFQCVSVDSSLVKLTTAPCSSASTFSYSVKTGILSATLGGKTAYLSISLPYGASYPSYAVISFTTAALATAVDVGGSVIRPRSATTLCVVVGSDSTFTMATCTNAGADYPWSGDRFSVLPNPKPVSAAVNNRTASFTGAIEYVGYDNYAYTNSAPTCIIAQAVDGTTDITIASGDCALAPIVKWNATSGRISVPPAPQDVANGLPTLCFTTVSGKTLFRPCDATNAGQVYNFDSGFIGTQNWTTCNYYSDFSFSSCDTYYSGLFAPLPVASTPVSAASMRIGASSRQSIYALYASANGISLKTAAAHVDDASEDDVADDDEEEVVTVRAKSARRSSSKSASLNNLVSKLAQLENKIEQIVGELDF